MTDRVANIVAVLKTEKCLKVLNDKIDLLFLHKLTMFLHPKLKSLKLLKGQGELMTANHDIALKTGYITN